MADESNLNIMTFVAVFDPETASFSLTAESIQKIELSSGKEVQGGEGVTERGPARLLVVPRDQMDLIIENERVEVRRRYPGSALSEPISEMSNLFSIGLGLLDGDISTVTWRRFGYNFTMSINTDGPAAAKLAEGVFSDEYAKKLKYDLIGAANWLWLKVGDAVLWLRLEPQRNDPATKRVIVTANFLEENGLLPTENQVATKLQKYW